MTELEELRARIEALEMWLDRPWPKPLPSRSNPLDRPPSPLDSPAPKMGDRVNAATANALPVGSAVLPSIGGSLCVKIPPEPSDKGPTMNWEINNGLNTKCDKLYPCCDWDIIRLGPAPDAPEHHVWPLEEI